MRRLWACLVVLLAVAFGLRIYRLPQLSLRADEAATVFEAGVPWEKLVRILSRPGPHQPLYYLLLHGWMKVAGDSELAVRALTLLAGVLLLPLVYVLGRRLTPPRAGRLAFWATLLATMNPLLIWDAQDNRMYPLLAVFNLASVYLGLAILEDRGGWKSWLGYVLSTTLALFTHYLALFILITENVIWAILIWRVPQRLQRTGRWLAAQIAVVVLFGPWAFKVISTVTSYFTNFLPPVSLVEFLRRTAVGLSLGFSVDATNGTILAMGFLGVFALGLLPLGSELGGNAAKAPGRIGATQSRIFLLAYLGIPLLCIALFSSVRFPIFDERYAMLALPPFLLLLARGLSNLERPGAKRWLAAIGLVWILIASGYSLRNYYFVPRYIKGVDWRTYVARLVECARPGDVLVQNYPDQGLTYHLRERMPRVLLPSQYPLDVEATQAELERLSQAHSRIWLQPQRYERWDSEGFVETWLDRHALKVGEEAFGEVRLALYLPTGTLLEAIQPVPVVLNNRIRLLGYLLQEEHNLQAWCAKEPTPHFKPALIRPGSTVRLALLWQADAEITEDYTVFTHLYDGSHRLWGQMDSPPGGGTFPTSHWRPDELVVDRYQIPIESAAPPGDYRLMVGMYNPGTGERLPVEGESRFLGGDHRILLGTVRVSQ